jgi:hypothetical protein
MDVKFPFEYAGKEFFGPIYRPVARVSLQSPKNKTWITTWMVVDTGADFTILPRYLSEDLAISLEADCVMDTTRGVGGEQAIYLVKKKLSAKIGRLSRQVPLAFFTADEVPPLLGRLGFLETFNTEFLKSHFVVFKD